VVEIVSETEAFPVAVALVIPALSGEVEAPVAAARVAAVRVALPVWEVRVEADPGAVAVGPGVVAADAVDDVSIRDALGGNNEIRTA
jgi:hypothetical protein